MGVLKGLVLVAVVVSGVAYFGASGSAPDAAGTGTSIAATPRVLRYETAGGGAPFCDTRREILGFEHREATSPYPAGSTVSGCFFPSAGHPVKVISTSGVLWTADHVVLSLNPKYPFEQWTSADGYRAIRPRS